MIFPKSAYRQIKNFLHTDEGTPDVVENDYTVSLCENYYNDTKNEVFVL